MAKELHVADISNASVNTQPTRSIPIKKDAGIELMSNLLEQYEEAENYKVSGLEVARVRMRRNGTTSVATLYGKLFGDDCTLVLTGEFVAAE